MTKIPKKEQWVLDLGETYQEQQGRLISLAVSAHDLGLRMKCSHGHANEHDHDEADVETQSFLQEPNIQIL